MLNHYNRAALITDSPPKTIDMQCNAIQDNLTSPGPKDRKWFLPNCLKYNSLRCLIKKK